MQRCFRDCLHLEKFSALRLGSSPALQVGLQPVFQLDLQPARQLGSRSATCALGKCSEFQRASEFQYSSISQPDVISVRIYLPNLGKAEQSSYARQIIRCDESAVIKVAMIDFSSNGNATGHLVFLSFVVIVALAAAVAVIAGITAAVVAVIRTLVRMLLLLLSFNPYRWHNTKDNAR